MGAFPKEEELKKLLPWSEDLPEYCRTKLKKNTKPSDRESGRQPGTVSDGFYKMSIYEWLFICYLKNQSKKRA